MLDNSTLVWLLIIVVAILSSVIIIFFTRFRGGLFASMQEGGRLLEGRYRIGFELGRGMNAVAYRVMDLNQPRIPLVAKILLTPQDEPRISTESFQRHIKRFRLEMQNLEKLKFSKFVVPVHEFHPDCIRPFYVMRFCDNSLKDFITDTNLPMQDILYVLSDTCQGLEDSHTHNIIHRDLKPANILRYQGHWVLTDFGMSLLGGATSTITCGESVPGTFPYTAPEVMHYQSNRITYSADIFSVGVTLKEMLTGAKTLEGSASSLLRDGTDEQIKKEVILFNHLISDMTKMSPEERPQTIRVVMRGLYLIFKHINETRAQQRASAYPPLEGIDRFTFRRKLQD